MQITKQNWLATLINFAVTLFFLSIFIVKGGYNVAPALLMLIGLGYGIYVLTKKSLLNLSKVDKWLIYSYLFYFLTFVLSLCINGGKMRDLDTASRVIFLIPVLLLLLKYPIKTCVLSYAIPLGGIVSVCIALYDKFILNLRPEQNPRIMHIQGGDISMSLGILSLIIALYAHQKKEVKLTALSVIGGLCGIVGSLLSTARGGWVALPVLLIVILYIYRHSLSKRFFLTFCGIIAITSVGISQMPNNRIMERINVAQKDIQLYLDKNNGNTSLGARFEMWKSAIAMAKEKPLFGWGIQGATEKRKQETKEKIATGNIGQFTHAHNQYLDDLSKRGIVGLLTLLAVLFIPLYTFMKNLKTANNEIKLIATLGVAHILSVMIYGLSQGFLVHNSGTIFYFFLTIVFYTAIRTRQKAE